MPFVPYGSTVMKLRHYTIHYTKLYRLRNRQQKGQYALILTKKGFKIK